MQPSNNPLRIELEAALQADNLALWFLFEGPEGYRGQAAALRYYEELEDVYQRVQAYPENYAFFEDGFRRAYFRNLPCLIYYEAGSEETIVYWIAHSREDESKVLERLRQRQDQTGPNQSH